MTSQNYTAIVNSFVKFNSKNNFLRHFLIGGRLRWLTNNTSFDIYVSFSEICDSAIDKQTYQSTQTNKQANKMLPILMVIVNSQVKSNSMKKNCITFLDLRSFS